MNPILSKLLGVGEMGLGAVTGNGRVGRAGFNRVTQPQGGFNYWASTHASPTVPGARMSNLSTPPLVTPSPTAASQLPYSSGGGSPMPITPAFRMPSAYGDPESMQ